MVAPLFDAAMRKFFRDLTNSVTDYGTTVGIRFVNRRPDGTIIRDRSGAATYAAATDWKALVIWEQQLIVAKDNTQRVAKGTVTFSFPPPAVTVDDRIVVDGREYEIIGVGADDSADPMIATKVYV